MMPEPTLARIHETCLLIKQDMENDASRFDGAPVDGRVVAEIHGNLAAAISALAGMIDVLAVNGSTDA